MRIPELSPEHVSDNDRLGFRTAEYEGIRLAAKGRLIALACFAAYSLMAFDGPLLRINLTYLTIFAVIALLTLMTARMTSNHPWLIYVLVMVEILLLAQAVLSPNPFNPEPWPEPMVFRYDNFYYFFVFIGISAFSYSPWLVAWAGFVTAAAWTAGVYWIYSKPGSQSFVNTATGLASNDSLQVYIDPNTIVLSGRAVEIVSAVVVSLLLAAVVWRGRRTVATMLQADRERKILTDLFGRYVPHEVAQDIIEDRGMLRPEVRNATILFADIEDFTGTVERMQPVQALNMLNEYFAAATQLIGHHGGVVTQFQGDAILASFNVPLADDNHAGNAVRAAVELLSLVESKKFGGERLTIRIGINTGNVVAGSVGGSGRMFYTVHGDAVNTAARLEQLNKSYGTHLLVDGDTRKQCGTDMAWSEIDTVTPRGRSASIDLYSITPST